MGARKRDRENCKENRTKTSIYTTWPKYIMPRDLFITMHWKQQTTYRQSNNLKMRKQRNNTQYNRLHIEKKTAATHIARIEKKIAPIVCHSQCVEVSQATCSLLCACFFFVSILYCILWKMALNSIIIIQLNLLSIREMIHKHAFKYTVFDHFTHRHTSFHFYLEYEPFYLLLFDHSSIYF